MSEAVSAAVVRFTVPGVGWTIEEALATLTYRCTHMREGYKLCDQVTQRMRALYEEILRNEDEGALRKNKVLPQFGDEIFKLHQFVIKHKEKHTLARLLARHKFEEAILNFHANIDSLYQLLKATHIAESAMWRAKYDENERVHRERLELIISQNGVIIAEIRG
ncbi:hypothetical protein FI667_g5709, partial [Globisporangium splendens]